jgi:hypothetical protein
MAPALIATEKQWRERLEKACTHQATAEELRRDAVAARNLVIREADEAGIDMRTLSTWTGLSRTSVNDIVTGRSAN